MSLATIVLGLANADQIGSNGLSAQAVAVFRSKHHIEVERAGLAPRSVSAPASVPLVGHLREGDVTDSNAEQFG